jgi:hypothetical protein
LRYLLLIYDKETTWTEMSPEDSGQVLKEYFAYGDAIKGEGIFLAGDALQPTPTAKTVRVRDGQRAVTDGPFAETKEQLGGYYLVDCETEEQALRAAERIPSARFGSIEVRPLMEFPEEARDQ